MIEKMDNIFIINEEHIQRALISISKNSEVDNKNIKIISDVTNESLSKSDYNNFVSYFNDRYNKLSQIIKSKMLSFYNIKDLDKFQNTLKKQVSIIGMITDKKYTSNQKLMLTVEDPTGYINILIDIKDENLFQIGSDLILDEVIGIVGYIINSNRTLFATKIVHPDIPNLLPTKYSNG